MYTRMYTAIHLHTATHFNAPNRTARHCKTLQQTATNVHTHTHTLSLSHTHAHTHAHSHTYTHTHAHTHTHTCALTHVP